MTSARKSASSSGVRRCTGSREPPRANHASAARAAIPARLGGLPVTAVGAGAWRGERPGMSSGWVADPSASPAAVAAGGAGPSLAAPAEVAVEASPGASGRDGPEEPLPVPARRGPGATRSARAPEEEPGQAGTAVEAGYGSGPCVLNLLGLTGRRVLPGGGSGRETTGSNGSPAKGGRKSLPDSGVA